MPKPKRAPLTRSQIMARIRSKDTKPEWLVRRLLHRQGFRYRVHVRGLPGTPDVAVKGRRLAILVHGCFWHAHEGCRHGRMPKTNLDFWLPKLTRNRQRDAEKLAALEGLGYRVLVLWECEVADTPEVAARLAAFMAGGPLATAPGRDAAPGAAAEAAPPLAATSRR
ncbi:MAG TPA: very short patch repair endonuclease [Alphaproteobacteria bacterium]|nr:very short patch repair endonuclease [Alphaproteobacteria bacterium]